MLEDFSVGLEGQIPGKVFFLQYFFSELSDPFHSSTFAAAADHPLFDLVFSRLDKFRFIAAARLVCREWNSRLQRVGGPSPHRIR